MWPGRRPAQPPCPTGPWPACATRPRRAPARSRRAASVGRQQPAEAQCAARACRPLGPSPVSYTHLTLPTICSV
eukprot:12498488-Alexandrium_andersonii.AAC.1